MKSLLKTTLLAAFLAVGTIGAASAGDNPSYCHDESQNTRGSNQCSSNADCDGLRTCSGAGWCQGTNRDTSHTTCSNKNWLVNTDLTGNGVGGYAQAQTITDCEAECNANAACVGWTFQGGGACHLKTSVTSQYNKGNNVSGLK